MADFKIFVGDRRIREKKSEELCTKGAPVGTTVIVPAWNVGSPKSMTCAGSIHISDFTLAALEGQFKTEERIVVEEAHKLSVDSIDGLIAFGRKWHIDIYLLSAKADGNSVIYPILRYLSDQGYDIQELDNFGPALQPVEPVKKNNNPPTFRDKKPLYELRFQDILDSIDNKNPVSQKQINDLFQTIKSANDAARIIKRQIAANAKPVYES
jgi:hypothetical protein